MISSQFIGLTALPYQLRSQLVLDLRINLVLLAQFVQYLAQVTPAQPEELGELLTGRVSGGSAIE